MSNEKKSAGSKVADARYHGARSGTSSAAREIGAKATPSDKAKGGEATAHNRTASQRSEAASKAVNARWGNKK